MNTENSPFSSINQLKFIQRQQTQINMKPNDAIFVQAFSMALFRPADVCIILFIVSSIIIFLYFFWQMKQKTHLLKKR